MARATVQVLQARAANAAADEFEESLGRPRSLGEALQRYRSQERLTLREMSKVLGVSAQYLSDLERGVRHASVVRAAEWAAALRVPAATFVRLVLQHQVDETFGSLLAVRVVFA